MCWRLAAWHDYQALGPTAHERHGAASRRDPKRTDRNGRFSATEASEDTARRSGLSVKLPQTGNACRVGSSAANASATVCGRPVITRVSSKRSPAAINRFNSASEATSGRGQRDGAGRCQSWLRLPVPSLLSCQMGGAAGAYRPHGLWATDAVAARLAWRS
jgi:hypothetical protein